MSTAVVRVSLATLGQRLLGDETLRQEAIRRGMASGADRGNALLVRKSRKHNDQGQYMNSWHVPARKNRDLVTVRNDAPHAGIIERGARPHGVNQEGREALLAWVLRNIAPTTRGPLQANQAGQMAFWNKAAVSKAKKYLRAGRVFDAKQLGKRSAKSLKNIHDVLDAAQAIVEGICRKLKAVGQEPLWIVRNNLDELRRLAGLEIRREIKTAAGAVAFGKALGSL